MTCNLFFPAINSPNTPPLQAFKVLVLAETSAMSFVDTRAIHSEDILVWSLLSTLRFRYSWWVQSPTGYATLLVRVQHHQSLPSRLESPSFSKSIFYPLNHPLRVSRPLYLLGYIPSHNRVKGCSISWSATRLSILTTIKIECKWYKNVPTVAETWSTQSWCLELNKEKRLAINIDIDISFTALLCVLDHLKNCVA